MRRLHSISVLSVVMAAILLTALSARGGDSDKLVAHEWGTFTTLQDEKGRELSGINIDMRSIHVQGVAVADDAIIFKWRYRFSQ